MPKKEAMLNFEKFYDSLTGGRKKAFFSKVIHGDIVLYEQIMNDDVRMILEEDDRFVLHESFEVTIPKMYDYYLGLETFFKEFKIVERDFPYLKLKPESKDQLVAQLLRSIVAGSTYSVGLFKITKRIIPKYCTWFLRRQNAVNIGPLEIAILWPFIKQFIKAEVSRFVFFNCKNVVERPEFVSIHHPHDSCYIRFEEEGEYELMLDPYCDFLMCVCEKSVN